MYDLRVPPWRTGTTSVEDGAGETLRRTTSKIDLREMWVWVRGLSPFSVVVNDPVLSSSIVTTLFVSIAPCSSSHISRMVPSVPPLVPIETRPREHSLPKLGSYVRGNRTTKVTVLVLSFILIICKILVVVSHNSGFVPRGNSYPETH